MHTDESDSIFITDEESGQRLDRVLALRYKEVQSRTYFQNLIENEQVLVNEKPAKKRLKLQPGDEVFINFVPGPEIGLAPENISLDIIYEDNDIIAVNKPVGMVVHPAPG